MTLQSCEAILSVLETVKIIIKDQWFYNFHDYIFVYLVN